MHGPTSAACTAGTQLGRERAHAYLLPKDSLRARDKAQEPEKRPESSEADEGKVKHDSKRAKKPELKPQAEPAQTGSAERPTIAKLIVLVAEYSALPLSTKEQGEVAKLLQKVGQNAPHESWLPSV